LLQDEILDVAGKIFKAGMSLLVIDTENKFISTGFAKEIARVAQGCYFPHVAGWHVDSVI
jgi:magnesium chelatase subunit D